MPLNRLKVINTMAAKRPKLHTHMQLELAFLGTSSSRPSTSRNQSSLSIRKNGELWLFDCGEASLRQFPQIGYRSSTLSRIFITHLHADHVCGLISLLCDRLMKPETEQPVDWKSKPLVIYGPTGLREFIRANLHFTGLKAYFPYVVHELRSNKTKHEAPILTLNKGLREIIGDNIQADEKGCFPAFLEDDEFVFSAANIEHSIECLGYLVREKDRGGTIDVTKYLPQILKNKDALAEQGIRNPHTLLGSLQRGEVVNLPDKTILEPPSAIKGIKLVILGDTCNPRNMLSLNSYKNEYLYVSNPDLLIHEATSSYTDDYSPDCDLTIPSIKQFHDRARIALKEKVKSNGHSTAEMAGKFANKLGAKNLALNHFSPKYAKEDPSLKYVKKEAEKSFRGNVICSYDFLRLKLDPNQIIVQPLTTS